MIPLTRSRGKASSKCVSRALRSSGNSFSYKRSTKEEKDAGKATREKQACRLMKILGNKTQNNRNQTSKKS